jgi:hypothetical protein
MLRLAELHPRMKLLVVTRGPGRPARMCAETPKSPWIVRLWSARKLGLFSAAIPARSGVAGDNFFEGGRMIFAVEAIGSV